MPQQLLDLSQVRTHVEQVRGIAMAQTVGVHAIGNPGGQSTALQQAPNIPVTEPPNLVVPPHPQ